MRTNRERVIAIQTLADSGFYRSAIISLLRHATTLHRLAEEACNRELTRAEIAKQQRLMERVESIVLHQPRRGAGRYVAKFNGDPRGYAVKILGLERADASDTRPVYNSWGGETEGFGI